MRRKGWKVGGTTSFYTALARGIGTVGNSEVKMREQ
jgi:hypothetical protein